MSNTRCAGCNKIPDRAHRGCPSQISGYVLLQRDCVGGIRPLVTSTSSSGVGVCGIRRHDALSRCSGNDKNDKVTLKTPGYTTYLIINTSSYVVRTCHIHVTITTTDKQGRPGGVIRQPGGEYFLAYAYVRDCRLAVRLVSGRSTTRRLSAKGAPPSIAHAHWRWRQHLVVLVEVEEGQEDAISCNRHYHYKYW